MVVNRSDNDSRFETGDGERYQGAPSGAGGKPSDVDIGEAGEEISVLYVDDHRALAQTVASHLERADDRLSVLVETSAADAVERFPTTSSTVSSDSVTRSSRTFETAIGVCKNLGPGAQLRGGTRFSGKELLLLLSLVRVALCRVITRNNDLGGETS